ncbi:hypothetical protein QE430_003326 [Microbacterium testaceum]|nr:hypothetical protein [Microbacterium testaceum]
MQKAFPASVEVIAFERVIRDYPLPDRGSYEDEDRAISAICEKWGFIWKGTV